MRYALSVSHTIALAAHVSAFLQGEMTYKFSEWVDGAHCAPINLAGALIHHILLI